MLRAYALLFAAQRWHTTPSNKRLRRHAFCVIDEKETKPIIHSESRNTTSSSQQLSSAALLWRAKDEGAPSRSAPFKLTVGGRLDYIGRTHRREDALLSGSACVLLFAAQRSRRK